MKWFIYSCVLYPLCPKVEHLAGRHVIQVKSNFIATLNLQSCDVLF